jgi:hypothetical protein
MQKGLNKKVFNGRIIGATTLSIMTLGIMTLSITIKISTPGLTTLSDIALDTVDTFMLSVLNKPIMLSVIMLIAVMPSVMALHNNAQNLKEEA